MSKDRGFTAFFGNYNPVSIFFNHNRHHLLHLIMFALPFRVKQEILTECYSLFFSGSPFSLLNCPFYFLFCCATVLKLI